MTPSEQFSADGSDAGGVQAEDMPVCVCGHTIASHDAVATRYCAATADHVRVRGCICKIAPPGDLSRR